MSENVTDPVPAWGPNVPIFVHGPVALVVLLWTVKPVSVL